MRNFFISVIVTYSLTGCGGGSTTSASTPAAVESFVGQLNDTGITDLSPELFTANAGMDENVGRDALAIAGKLQKLGNGTLGFDFTKLDAAGNNLIYTAANWSCVKDNVTGLIWEVKTADGGLQDFNRTYLWYNTDTSSKGGVAGTATTPNGNQLSAHSNTQACVTAINTLGLCGAKNWRLPDVSEIESIIHFGRPGLVPKIEPSFFPNTAGEYWTSSVAAVEPRDAWWISFDNGRVSTATKVPTSNFLTATQKSVRLVRASM